MLKIIHKHKIILNNFFILNTSFFIIVLCQIIERVITNIRWYKNGVIIHAVFIYGVFRFIANCFTCNSLFLANSSSRHLGHLVSVFDRLLSCVCHEWPFLHFHHTGTELLALTVSGVKGRFFSSSHSSNKYCFFLFFTELFKCQTHHPLYTFNYKICACFLHKMQLRRLYFPQHIAFLYIPCYNDYTPYINRRCKCFLKIFQEF